MLQRATVRHRHNIDHRSLGAIIAFCDSGKRMYRTLALCGDSCLRFDRCLALYRPERAYGSAPASDPQSVAQNQISVTSLVPDRLHPRLSSHQSHV